MGPDGLAWLLAGAGFAVAVALVLLLYGKRE